ncbi:hypothetical protein V2J09_002334 [Rumex salicifolius]
MGGISNLAVLAAAVMMAFWTAEAELERVEQPRKSDGTVSFLVIGDWGRKGNFNQSLVAHQMGVVGEKLEVDFVVSTGDNFYDNGLTGVDDPAFEESFTNIYTAPSLQKPWYTVLGNHDYRGDVEAQLSPVLKAIDERWICKRSFIVSADELVELFFVDTTPFADKYFEEKDHSYDWTGVLPRHQYLSSLLSDVEVALKESSAKWKIVVGHHTIRSAGHHGDTTELATQLLPILHENNVDLYINGHDHCLEHISSPHSQLQFLTSGGGSKAWRGDIKWWNPKEMKFYHDGQGFMSAQVTDTQLSLVFYDVFGSALHAWSTTSKALYSSA